MQVVIAFIFGVALGIAVTYYKFKPNIAGVLRIDRSEPNEPPYFFLECDKATELDNDYVTFKVTHKNYISQK